MRFRAKLLDITCITQLASKFLGEGNIALSLSDANLSTISVNLLCHQHCYNRICHRIVGTVLLAALHSIPRHSGDHFQECQDLCSETLHH